MNIRKLLKKSVPIGTAIHRVSSIAVHLQKPTALGIAACGASLLADASSLIDTLNPGKIFESFTFSSPDDFIQRCISVGFTSSRSATETIVRRREVEFILNNVSGVLTCSLPLVDQLSIQRELYASPTIVELAFDSNNRFGVPKLSSGFLTSRCSEEAVRILKATEPFLIQNRAILLTGKPGVGKTCMAHFLAEFIAKGERIVLLGKNMLDTGVVAYTNTYFETLLKVLQPKVVVVDELDKAKHINLPLIDILHIHSPLTVFTANNGEYDTVIDGALIRAGRIDETFEIKTGVISVQRVYPFDRLDDVTWRRIREWPIAYLQEISSRIIHRGVGTEDLRLDEIEERIGRRVRSGDTQLPKGTVL